MPWWRKLSLISLVLPDTRGPNENWTAKVIVIFLEIYLDPKKGVSGHIHSSLCVWAFFQDAPNFLLMKINTWLLHDQTTEWEGKMLQNDYFVSNLSTLCMSTHLKHSGQQRSTLFAKSDGLQTDNFSSLNNSSCLLIANQAADLSRHFTCLFSFNPQTTLEVG